jgi:hypothetical protein
LFRVLSPERGNQTPSALDGEKAVPGSYLFTSIDYRNEDGHFFGVREVRDIISNHDSLASSETG